MLYACLKARKSGGVTEEHHEDPAYPWPSLGTLEDTVLMGKLDKLRDIVVLGSFDRFETIRMGFLGVIEEQ